MTWTFPSGSTFSYGPETNDFHVFDNNVWGDQNAVFGISVNWLQNQSFSITATFPKEWQDEYGNWSAFQTSNHVFGFSGFDYATSGNIINGNVPNPGGPAEGPWCAVP